MVLIKEESFEIDIGKELIMNLSDYFSHIDLSSLSTEERRKLINSLKKYHDYFYDSINNHARKQQTKSEAKKTEKKMHDYSELMNRVKEKCWRNVIEGKSSTGKEISVLSGAASTDAKLEAIGCGLIKLGGHGITEGGLSSSSGFYKMLESILPQGASDKEINEQLMIMLHTTVAMLEKCNISEKEIKDALTDTVRAVADIKNKYSDIIDDEELAKNVQDECAAWILDNIKTGADYDNCRSKVIKNIGPESWERMKGTSQTFLINAEVLYEQLKYYSDFDYSVICMTASKALEVEISKRYFSGYMEYLREEGIEPLPSGVLNKWSRPIDEKEFMLGRVTDITGYAVREGSAVLLPKYVSDSEVFLDYADKRLLHESSRGKCKGIIKKHIVMIDNVREKYRNPAAHKSKMSIAEAKGCLDYLIDVERALGVIIEDCNW